MEAVDRETIRPRMDQRYTPAPRVPWWRNALMALGITIGGGLVINEVFFQPTQEQKRAEAAFNNPTIPRRTLRVVNDPEVIESGGLAVRNKPGIDTPDNQSLLKRLPPDYVIKDAISWVPIKPDLPSNKGGWVAFRNEEGKFMFASAEFLAEIPNPSKP